MGSDRQALIDQLIVHEGLKLLPYMDTVGKVTIGVGRNLTDKGISRNEAMLLLDNDINEVVDDLMGFPWFMRLDPIRQRALEDLRFNLGPARFRAFKQTLASVAAGDYATAARQLRESKWYGQVGKRGPALVHMLGLGTV